MNKSVINKTDFKPGEHSGFLLWQTSNKWQRDFNKLLSKYELTHVQFLLLAGAASLNKQKKSTTQIALADFASIEKMMASKVLRTLEMKKLIKRNFDKADSRAWQIVTTSAGIALLVKALREMVVFDKLFFASIMKKQKGFNKRLKELIISVKN